MKPSIDYHLKPKTPFMLRFTLLIPILIMLISNLAGYFPVHSMHPGTVAGPIILVFLLFFIVLYYPKDRLNTLIFLYALYYFVLCAFSSNYIASYYEYMKFFIHIFMFPLGYYYINTYERFQRLTKMYFITLVLFTVNVVIANVFKIGSSDYLESSFYFGMGGVNVTKIMIILLFASANLFPLLKQKQKKYFILFLFMVVLVVIMGVKRTALLSLVVGVILFFFYNQLKHGSLKFVFASVFSLLLFMLIFSDSVEVMQQRLEARGENLGLTEESIEKEARYTEVHVVLKTWINGSISHKLFGSELFNDTKFFNTYRMLHTDYMVILNGSGIVGMAMWFLILYGIFKRGKYCMKNVKNDIRLPFLKASFYSILVAQIILSTAGTIQGYETRTFILLYLGATIGMLKGEFGVEKQRNK